MILNILIELILKKYRQSRAENVLINFFCLAKGSRTNDQNAYESREWERVGEWEREIERGVLDSYDWPHVETDMFRAMLLWRELNRWSVLSPWATCSPHFGLTCLLTDCSPMAALTDHLTRKTCHCIYSLDVPHFFPSGSAHMIHFRCPLFILKHICTSCLRNP